MERRKTSLSEAQIVARLQQQMLLIEAKVGVFEVASKLLDIEYQPDLHKKRLYNHLRIIFSDQVDNMKK